MQSVPFRIIDLSWADWKTCVARPNVVTYYTVESGGVTYETFGMDGRFVYHASISDSDSITDFTTNYQTGAIVVPGIDDAIAFANKMDGTNSVIMDSSGNMVSTFSPPTTGVVCVDTIQRSSPTADPSESVWVYGELTTTSTTADQLVVSYTVPSGKNFYLMHSALYHGNQGGIVPNPATLFVGTNILANRLGSYAQVAPLTQAPFVGWKTDFAIPVIAATSGQTIKLTVTPQSGLVSTLWCGRIVGIIR